MLVTETPYARYLREEIADLLAEKRRARTSREADDCTYRIEKLRIELRAEEGE